MKKIIRKTKLKPLPTPYWTNVLERAEERMKAGKAPFTVIESYRSVGWTTCACGKQDPRIPRSTIGEPRDDRLSDLGGEFTEYVCNTVDFWSVSRADAQRSLAAAKKTLTAIERRAAQVLAEVS